MKRTTNALPNYPLFVSLTHIVVLTGAFFALSPAAVPAVARRVEQRTFALLGALDALAGVLVLLGSVHTSGPTQQLLMQGRIPLTMLCSWLVFGKRYGVAHLLGAALILAGVGIVLSPAVGAASSAAGSSRTELAFNGIYFLATLPMVGANLFKEAALQEDDIDGNYLNARVGLWQIAFTVLCLPLNSLPLLGAGSVPLAELPVSLARGAACVFGGFDSVTSATHADCVHGLTPGALSCDVCAGAWVPLTAYIVANFALNYILTELLKHAGATTTVAVMTMAMPIQALAFSLPAVMGEAAKPFAQEDLAGLAVIVAGIAVYRRAGPAAPAANTHSKAS
eukprot:g6808.t1